MGTTIVRLPHEKMKSFCVNYPFLTVKMSEHREDCKFNCCYQRDLGKKLLVSISNKFQLGLGSHPIPDYQATNPQQMSLLLARAVSAHINSSIFPSFPSPRKESNLYRDGIGDGKQSRWKRGACDFLCPDALSVHVFHTSRAHTRAFLSVL